MRTSGRPGSAWWKPAGRCRTPRRGGPAWIPGARRSGCARRDHAHGEECMRLTGIHHLTAVSAKIAENYRFYTGVMGMRLVKRSVNQDDVSAYHLFYSDAVGSPGN